MMDNFCIEQVEEFYTRFHVIVLTFRIAKFKQVYCFEVPSDSNSCLDHDVQQSFTYLFNIGIYEDTFYDKKNFKILIHESSEFCLAFAEKEISKEDGVKEKVMFGEETSSQSVFYFIPINE